MTIIVNMESGRCGTGVTSITDLDHTGAVRFRGGMVLAAYGLHAEDPKIFEEAWT